MVHGLKKKTKDKSKKIKVQITKLTRPPWLCRYVVMLLNLFAFNLYFNKLIRCITICT